MKEKVLEYIIQNSMIKEGDKVLVALSGGPDSVCLLHLLYSLREKLNIEIFAAHVNHLIRGEEAFADEKYANELCDSLDIKFFVKRAKVEEIAKEKGISTEMAGRDERYDFFNEIKKQIGINKIAIAHNANDQAETLIMRIMRGTGIEGLVGIKPVRDNIFIRPILSLTRKEIEDYCDVNNLNPRIDKTNLEEIYSRNKVRLKAIPFIAENFNSDIINSLNRLAYSASVDAEFIDGIVLEKYDKYVILNDDNGIISSKAFLGKEAVLTRIIRKTLMDVSGAFNNFEMKHIYEVINLQRGSTGKKINLTNKLIAINQYGDVQIVREELLNKIDKDELIKLDVSELINDKSKIYEFNSYKFKFEIIDNNGKIDFSKNKDSKYFNFDSVATIKIRKRQNGDKMIPFGFNNEKKLKDIFISDKIPKQGRDSIAIIEFDDKIAWAVGVRNSEVFKIKKDNKKLLNIVWIREGEN